MRFKHSILATLSLLIVIAAACDSDDDKESPNLQPPYLTFEGTITGKAQVEGEDPLWPVNNIIGMYMTMPDEKAVINDCQNIRYISEKGDGKFTPGNKYTDVIYYPENNNNVRFISYSPYRSEMINGVYAIDLTQQSNQQTLDLLYAENTQNKPADDVVKMDFDHELSKVVFNIKAGESLTALNNLKVTITNLKAKADYRLLDRTFNEEEAATDLTMKTTVVDRVAVSEGIILPTEAAERKFVFRFTIGADTKTFEMDASEEVFLRAKKQTFNVTLERNEVKMNASSTIEDWGLGSSEVIIIDPTQDPSTGTKDNPFTIVKAQTRVGATEKWVAGYIIGSADITGALGTPVSSNIVIAEAATETDLSKCIIVDLEDSPMQDPLDLTVTPGLLGGKVFIQGDLIQGAAYNGAVVLSKVIAQEGGAEVQYVIKEFFSETFGTGTANVKLDEYDGFDMQSPVAYSNGAVRLDLQIQSDRFPDNVYFLTMQQHNGTAASDKAFIIDNIPSKGYHDMVLSYDYAAGNLEMMFSDVTLKCNGVEVALPSQKIKNRDRFEGVTVSIPYGTTKIEFVQDKATLSYMRLDNIKIKGKTVQRNN